MATAVEISCETPVSKVITEVGIFEDLLVAYPRGARCGSFGGLANDLEKSIVIVLRNERYIRLVIEVEDLQPTVAAIWKAIG